MARGIRYRGSDCTDNNMTTSGTCHFSSRSASCLLSDCGLSFLSKLMQDVYGLMGIHKVHATAYFPQTVTIACNSVIFLMFAYIHLELIYRCSATKLGQVLVLVKGRNQRCLSWENQRSRSYLLIWHTSTPWRQTGGHLCSCVLT